MQMAYGTKEIKALLDKRFPGEKFKRIYKQPDVTDPNLTIRTLESNEHIVCVISDFTGPTSVTAIELASPHRCTAILKTVIAEAIEQDVQEKDDDNFNPKIIGENIRNSSEMRYINNGEEEGLSSENCHVLSYENGKFRMWLFGDWQEPQEIEVRVSSDGYLYYIPGSMKPGNSDEKDITLSVKALTTRVIPTPTPLKKEYVLNLEVQDEEETPNYVRALFSICYKKYWDKENAIDDQSINSKELDILIEKFNNKLNQGSECTWWFDDDLFEAVGLLTKQEKLDYIEEFRQYLLAAGMTEVTF